MHIQYDTHLTYLHLERALAVIQEDDAQSEFGLFGDPGHGGEAPETAEPPLVVLHGHVSLSLFLSGGAQQTLHLSCRPENSPRK